MKILSLLLAIGTFILFLVMCLISFSFLFHQVDDTEVISFLLSTEIIPLCLRSMEMGSELSKTVKFTDLVFT